MGRNITMSMNEQMEESEASILHTYNRFPVVFEKGQGCHLYDSETEKLHRCHRAWCKQSPYPGWKDPAQLTS